MIPRLEESPIFACVGLRERQQLAQQATLRSRNAKDHFYLESTRARHVWIVACGRVRTCRSEASGRITTLEEFQVGDVFGLAALLGAGTYAETAQLLTPGSAWAIAAPAFQALMTRDARLSARLLALVANRLQRAHERLCGFAHDSVAARVARAVLDRDAGDRIRVTRQLLADAAGTTVETAIRVLRRFERAGWIETGTGWLRTLDDAALRRIAQGEPLPRPIAGSGDQ